MAVATSTAILIGAAVSIGTAAYSADQQAKAQKKAEEEARKVEDAAQAERDRLDQIARDERPEGEVATGIEFGKSTTKDKMGTAMDFAVPTSGGVSGLAATGGTGLGFSI